MQARQSCGGLSYFGHLQALSVDAFGQNRPPALVIRAQAAIKNIVSMFSTGTGQAMGYHP